MLTFASPFFTEWAVFHSAAHSKSRRTSYRERVDANDCVVTLSIGAMLGGISTKQSGYQWAFVANSISFLFSAWAVWNLRTPEGNFRPVRLHASLGLHGPGEWARDFTESLRYMWRLD